MVARLGDNGCLENLSAATSCKYQLLCSDSWKHRTFPLFCSWAGSKATINRVTGLPWSWFGCHSFHCCNESSSSGQRCQQPGRGARTPTPSARVCVLGKIRLHDWSCTHDVFWHRNCKQYFRAHFQNQVFAISCKFWNLAVTVVGGFACW